MLLVPVIPQLCFAFLAHKCAQVARYRLRCLFLPFFHGTRRFVAVEVTTGNVILSAVLAHILVRNSVSFLLVLDDVRLRRGLEVALVALDSLLVNFHVGLQCNDSDGDVIAEFAFVGSNLRVHFQDMADDFLSAVSLTTVCLEATEVADPGAPGARFRRKKMVPKMVPEMVPRCNFCFQTYTNYQNCPEICPQICPSELRMGSQY